MDESFLFILITDECIDVNIAWNTIEESKFL